MSDELRMSEELQELLGKQYVYNHTSGDFFVTYRFNPLWREFDGLTFDRRGGPQHAVTVTVENPTWETVGKALADKAFELYGEGKE